MLEQLGKPVMLAEIGTSDLSADPAGWVEQALKGVRQLDAVKAVVWFDADTPDADFRLRCEALGALRAQGARKRLKPRGCRPARSTARAWATSTGRGWDRRWSKVLGDGAHDVDRRPPNAQFLAEASDLDPGHALDAGAGHGAETLWLAERGWEVTAVDFSAPALDHARARADGLGLAERVEWLTADLGAWTPPAGRYDLVACLHVHVAGSVPEFVRRLAAGVAPGGTVILVGRPSAPGQTQVSVGDAVAALEGWEVLTAEDRGPDAVIRARRT